MNVIFPHLWPHGAVQIKGLDDTSSVVRIIVSLCRHNDVINTIYITQIIIFINVMSCILKTKIVKSYMQNQTCYCDMLSMVRRSLSKVNRALARAIVVVQLELQLRTGQIRIQRTFLT